MAAKTKMDNVCAMKEGCERQCSWKEFHTPDLQFWEEKAFRVPTIFGTFLIAPEDIRNDSGVFWRFDDAQVVADNMSKESGWRLPTPAEAQLIMAHIAVGLGHEMVLEEDLEAIGLERGGEALSEGACGTYFVVDKDRVGLYWTNAESSKSVVGRSGSVIRLKYGQGDISTLIIDKSGAKIRLIKIVK